MQPGKVWLVGAGPGDPELITVRGQRALREADVVLFDALSHSGLLDVCKEGVELRPVGKRGGQRSPSQTWITEQLISLAREGKKVVRLKGGDSFLFARGAEEAEDLARAGVAFEVVPGLSSPVGTAAYAGIALTHRDQSSSVTFITGSDRAGVEWSPEAWKRLATATDTICILMGMRRIEQIAGALMDGGRHPSTPTAVIQWGARPEQRVVVGQLDTIAALAVEKGLANPAVIVVGEVVRLREILRWYDNRPLFGKRILIPRPEHQARQTARAVLDRSAAPVIFPVIQIGEPPDPEAFMAAVRNSGSYDWVLFTSANGVERAFRVLDEAGLDGRVFAGARIAVIGPKTARSLKERGLVADLVAREFIGEELAKAVIEQGARRVLILRALVARDALPLALEEAGVHVDVVPAYETRPVPLSEAASLRSMLESKTVDAILFTSSSTVDSVCDLLGDDAPALLRSTTVSSIGPITTETARKHGLQVDVTASIFTVDGLLDALEEHFAYPAND